MTDHAAADTARDQVARLLALAPYLHDRGVVTVSEAARHLGVDEEQLVKDVRLLFVCGLPGGYPDDLIDVDLDALAGEEGERVIRVSNADYLSRPVRLSPSEATALVVALRTVADTVGEEGREVVDRTLAKLEAATADVGQVAHVEVASSAEQDAVVATLEQALSRGRQVRIRYHVPARDELSERVVDPRALAVVGELPYLDAWCHTARDDRVFRIDRIRAATVLDSPAAPHGEPRDLGADWFAAGTALTRVTLRLDRPAQWLPEYVRTAAVRPGPDDTLDVELDVASEGWLRRLLLRLAPHARVLAPVEVAEGIAGATRDALGLYDR